MLRESPAQSTAVARDLTVVRRSDEQSQKMSTFNLHGLFAHARVGL